MDSGGIYLFDEATKRLELVHHTGLSENFVKSNRSFTGESDNFKMTMAGRPVFTHKNALPFPVPAEYIEEGVRFAGMLPFKAEGNVIGCLTIASHTVDQIPDSHQNMLENLAAQIGQVILNARTTEKLRVSEENFRRLTENAQDLIYRFEFGDKPHFSYVSPSATAITGYTPEDHYQDPELGFKLVHPEDRHMLEELSQNLELYKKPLIIRWIKKDGTQIWTEQRNIPILDNEGHLAAIEGIAREITQQKNIEKELAKSNLRYQNYFEQSTEGIVVIEPADGSFIEYNDQVCRQLGYTREEFAILKVFDIDAEESEAETRDHFAEILRTGSGNFNTSQRKKSGELIQVNVVAKIIEYAEEKVYHCIWCDITEQGLALKALQASEEQYRSLFTGTPVGIFRTSRSGKAIHINPAMARILGFEDPTVATAYYTDLGTQLYLHKEDRQHFIEMIRARGEIYDFEYEARRIDNKTIWLSMDARKIDAQNSDEFYIDGFTVDISKRKESELQATEEKTRTQQYWDVAQNMFLALDTEQQVTMINPKGCEILGYSAEEVVGKNWFDHFLVDEDIENVKVLFNNLLHETISNMDYYENLVRCKDGSTRLIGEDIELVWEPGFDTGMILIDPSQIDQVLANLLVNARDAISKNGRVTIETETVFSAGNEEVGSILMAPGKYILLKVSDNGCGMDKHTLNHIFEPFFTTKGVGEGTGLGLATVYGIIKQNNGYINVYSEPGQGTSFKIYFPAVEEDQQKPGTESVGYAMVGGTETILMVEDEEVILKTGKYLLEDLGYTADVIAKQGILNPNVEFIEKPFPIQELGRKVRKILENGK